MTFALADRWVWDFWIARDGADFHLFFLQADRALGDPELRHWNVSIGHAVSTDLKRWQELGTCFRPSAEPAWDDGTTWTGSVIRRGSLWYLFYTGTSKAERCKKQRIGLATSTDLHRWQRHPGNPVIDLDARFYEEFDPASWHDRSLRDPWVVPDPAGNGFCMWFTARAKTGAADGRGVVGIARSDDLLSWKVEAPVTMPGDFGEVEVPQYLAIGGRFYLLFCSSARRTSAARRAALAREGRQPESGTHYFTAEAPSGPWKLAPSPFLAGKNVGSLYAGRVVEGPEGGMMFLGFLDKGPDGNFVGAISDPISLAATADGRLMLDQAEAESMRATGAAHYASAAPAAVK
jgi:beta-fructofuranosidase